MSAGTAKIDPGGPWKALADPTRREILDLLRVHPRTTGELAGAFAMTRFGVMKHLTVLVDAGLVLVRRRGRERWNHLNPVPIQELHRRWILPFAAERADALLRLRTAVERPPEEAMTATAGYDVLQLELLEVPIAADRATVWAALTVGAGAWWPKDFYSHPEPRGFQIEPRPGGRMWEDWGDGQGMVWATVLIVRNHELLEPGELTPAFGGPARTQHRFELVEQDGGTLLKLSDCVYGSVTEALRGQLEAGWKMLLVDGLKAHLER